MNILNWLSTYWWLLFWFLPLLYLYIRQKNKDTVADLKHSDSQFILELGFLILVIYLLQKFLFPKHIFFLISIPLFTIMWCAIINYLLRGNNKYMMESTIHLEKHYDINDIKIHISENTGHRLLVMDKSVYNSKKHIGDADYTFWGGTDKLGFCDLYLDNKGIFFHPQLPQFHNISIHNARLFLLKMKEDIPKLYRENVMLTWLSPYKTAYQQSLLAEKFPLHLTAIKNQYDYKPFKLVDTLEEMYDEKVQEAMKIGSTSENLDKSFSQIQKDLSTLLEKSEVKPEGD